MQEIGGCGSVRPTSNAQEESLTPRVYVSGNVSKSFIYCNIVKPVYNSHLLLTKAIEIFGSCPVTVIYRVTASGPLRAD